MLKQHKKGQDQTTVPGGTPKDNLSAAARARRALEMADSAEAERVAEEKAESELIKRIRALFHVCRC